MADNTRFYTPIIVRTNYARPEGYLVDAKPYLLELSSERNEEFNIPFPLNVQYTDYKRYFMRKIPDAKGGGLIAIHPIDSDRIFTKTNAEQVMEVEYDFVRGTRHFEMDAKGNIHFSRRDVDHYEMHGSRATPRMEPYIVPVDEYLHKIDQMKAEKRKELARHDAILQQEPEKYRGEIESIKERQAQERGWLEFLKWWNQNKGVEAANELKSLQNKHPDQYLGESAYPKKYEDRVREWNEYLKWQAQQKAEDVAKKPESPKAETENHYNFSKETAALVPVMKNGQLYVLEAKPEVFHPSGIMDSAFVIGVDRQPGEEKVFVSNNAGPACLPGSTIRGGWATLHRVAPELAWEISEKYGIARLGENANGMDRGADYLDIKTHGIKPIPRSVFIEMTKGSFKNPEYGPHAPPVPYTSMPQLAKGSPEFSSLLKENALFPKSGLVSLSAEGAASMKRQLADLERVKRQNAADAAWLRDYARYRPQPPVDRWNNPGAAYNYNSPYHNSSSWTDSRTRDRTAAYERLYANDLARSPSGRIYPGVGVMHNGEPFPSGAYEPMLTRAMRGGVRPARGAGYNPLQYGAAYQQPFAAPKKEANGLWGWLVAGAAGLLGFVGLSSIAGPLLAVVLAGALAVGAYYAYNYVKTNYFSNPPPDGTALTDNTRERQSGQGRQLAMSDAGHGLPNAADANRSKEQQQRPH